jgi:hypothetical protein
MRTIVGVTPRATVPNAQREVDGKLSRKSHLFRARFPKTRRFFSGGPGREPMTATTDLNWSWTSSIFFFFGLFLFLPIFLYDKIKSLIRPLR